MIVKNAFVFQYYKKVAEIKILFLISYNKYICDQ